LREPRLVRATPECASGRDIHNSFATHNTHYLCVSEAPQHVHQSKMMSACDECVSRTDKTDRHLHMIHRQARVVCMYIPCARWEESKCKHRSTTCTHEYTHTSISRLQRERVGPKREQPELQAASTAAQEAEGTLVALGGWAGKVALSLKAPFSLQGPLAYRGGPLA
jgi:hypothetical protein